MTGSPARRTGSTPSSAATPRPAIDALHVAALTSLAVSQPLFDLLARSPEFFGARQSPPGEIVALAAAVSLLPLAAVLAVEAAVWLLWRRRRPFVHAVLLALLFALFALQASKWIDPAIGRGALPLAATAGLAFTLVYRSLAWVRAVLTLLSSGVVLFPALFLTQPAIRVQLARAPIAEVRFPPPTHPVPVVLVVFDEFSLAALLDENAEIDAVRFPNFARFARRSTWFRNATAVSDDTVYAVPALLTGQYPTTRRSPVYREHPGNLFTALAGTHRLEVFEMWTLLCPPSDCLPRSRAPLRERLAQTVADLGWVYLHLALPEPLAARLPSVTASWKGFGRRADRPDDFSSRLDLRAASFEERSLQDPADQFAAFLAAIPTASEPGLYFLHTNLPHVPLQYLPTGRRYGPMDRDFLPDGLDDDRWLDDPWPAAQARQRYLLQVGFVDELLGRLLDRLESAGIFEKALIAITADHGVSFRPGAPRRIVTAANLEELARVPLLIKRPGQVEGAIDDRDVETVDLLPSLAEVLGLKLAWQVDGRSVFEESSLPRVTKRIYRGSTPTSLQPERRDFERLVKELAARFGARQPWDSVYEIGPRPEVVGRAALPAPAPSSDACQFELEGARFLRAPAPASDFVPVHVRGELHGDAHCRELELAIQVNGIVRATTRTRFAAGRVSFSAMIPEQALAATGNTIELFAFRDAAGGETSLEALRPASEPDDRAIADGAALMAATREPEALAAALLAGAVDRVAIYHRTLVVAGWALEPASRQPAAEIVVLVDGELAYSGAPSIARPDLDSEGIPAAPAPAGFDFTIPLRQPLPQEPWRVRVFALARQGAATELAHTRRYLLETPADGGSVRLRRAWDAIALPLAPELAEGGVESVRFDGDRLSIRGSAVARNGRAPVEEVAVFLGDRFLAAALPASRGGFELDLYAGGVNLETTFVRAFALLADGQASEIPVPPAWQMDPEQPASPWSPAERRGHRLTPRPPR